MEPIFDRTGAVVGWLHEGRILDRSNRYRGFVKGDAVYAMGGQYLGRFRNGFFRDRSGGAVAFIQGASGGPLLPITQIPPVPPIPPIPPINPVPPIPPIPPVDSLSWGVDWDEFLNG
ncbi:4-fold beta flower protein [Rhodocaloribacter litoris]|uniref:4-fold beta flower protein n=1 Tax=Rhodocaloribacter litoris TaxID=2558931 RepID=UPI003C6E066F